MLRAERISPKRALRLEIIKRDLFPAMRCQ
jgi:hypothetical protein